MKSSLVIRRADPGDLAQLSAMCQCLWPEADAQEHARELAPLLAGKAPGNLPATVLLAEEPDGRAVGFIQVGLRSHADGCDASTPVGFVEGWYVAPDYRRRQIGARLLTEAERWALEKGCHEMASDTWLDNLESQEVHRKLGFEVVDRCVHFRKPLH